MFTLLKNRVRAFRERTQEKGEKEKQDLSRTVNFGCGFFQGIYPTRYVSLS